MSDQPNSAPGGTDPAGDDPRAQLLWLLRRHPLRAVTSAPLVGAALAMYGLERARAARRAPRR